MSYQDTLNKIIRDIGKNCAENWQAFDAHTTALRVDFGGLYSTWHEAAVDEAELREFCYAYAERFPDDAEFQEALNDIDADRLIGSGYFVAVDWYDTVKSKAAAVRHVVSDHEHLDDDAKLAEWYAKVVDNEICYHLDDALSDTWFTVVDAFTYTALCYVLELVHEAICDGKEM